MKYLIFLIACAGVTALCYTFNAEKTEEIRIEALRADSLHRADSLDHLLLMDKATAAKEFCIKKNYNTDFCMLINMHMHSGLSRFFIWDMKNNMAVDSGLVSHGCGNNPWGRDYSKTNPVFSNVYESHCSSLGKYKIGSRGYSNWGIHVNYSLYGLDSTNSNANGRNICIHGWEMVEDIETFPDGTPEGWGCTAVSNAFMQRLDDKMQTAKKPVLLWIFNE